MTESLSEKYRYIIDNFATEECKSAISRLREKREKIMNMMKTMPYDSKEYTKYRDIVSKLDVEIFKLESNVINEQISISKGR